MLEVRTALRLWIADTMLVFAKRWIPSLFPPVALVLVICIHVVLVTHGTGEFLGEELRSSSYDSLGDSLLRGRADVRPDTINWEGMDIGGKKYMYFGPLPSLPRMILNAVWPSEWGRWARITCLLASTLSLLACWAIASFSLKANRLWSATDRALLTGLSILFLGLGSPLLYLMTSGRIYHEAIGWALAASLWGVYGALAVLYRWISPTKAWLILSTATAAALLARVTFGVPLYIIVTILMARECLRVQRDVGPSQKLREVSLLALRVAPAIIALGIQLWYNYARFSSLTIFLDFRYNYLHPEQFGGSLNLRRAPILLLNYLDVRFDYITSAFPFARMIPCDYQGARFFWLAYTEQVISLLFSSPWLIATGIWGAIVIIRKRDLWYGACIIGLGTQIVGIVSFYFASQRYATEFVPWFMLCSAIVLMTIKKWSWPGWSLTLAVLAFSTIATIGSTMHWVAFYASDLDVPMRFRERVINFLVPTIGSPPWSGKRVYLDDLPRQDSHSFMAPKTAKELSPKDMKWADSRFDHAVWAHANTTLRVDVPAGSTAFESIVAIPYEAVNCLKLSIVFSVVNDRGEELFRSDRFVAPGRNPRAKEPRSDRLDRTDPQFLRVPLGDARSIALVLADAGDGRDCDHGVWLMPAFLQGDLPEGR